VPESNLVAASKRGAPQHVQRYVPGSCLSQYSPLNARSVPFLRAILYCSGVSSFCHSASDLVTLSAMRFLLRERGSVRRHCPVDKWGNSLIYHIPRPGIGMTGSSIVEVCIALHKPASPCTNLGYCPNRPVPPRCESDRADRARPRHVAFFPARAAVDVPAAAHRVRRLVRGAGCARRDFLLRERHYPVCGRLRRHPSAPRRCCLADWACSPAERSSRASCLASIGCIRSPR
jgi:hypothetical protein